MRADKSQLLTIMTCNVHDVLEMIAQYVHRENAYRKISNKRRTKSQNSNVSHFGFALSLHNILNPGVKLRMKM